MKIETESLETHEIKVTLEIDPPRFEQAKKKAARLLAKSTKIPGFRPGKAPYGVILKHFGESNIIEKAVDELIQDVYPEMIDELDIEPHGPGTLENVSSMEPPTFEFVIPLKSTVELGDYETISIDYEVPEVTDEDIEDTINRYREQQAVLETVDRSAAIGDLVRLSVKGTPVLTEDPAADADEDVDDDESPADNVFKEREYTLELVEEEESDVWPYMGFAQEVIGKSAGDTGTAEHTYPEDDPNEFIQNKTYQFEYTIENVQSKTLPELDDELAKSASDFDTLDEFRKDIREALEKNSIAQYDEEYNTKILDEIIENSTIKYPPQMLDQEIRDIRRDMENRLAQQGISKEMYLKIRNVTEEDLNEEIRPAAERRISETLVLLEIAEKEGVEINTEQIEQQANWTMDYMTSSLSPREARKIDRKEILPNIYTNIMLDALTQKTLGLLRSRSMGEEEEVVEVAEDSEAIEDAVEVIQEVEVSESSTEETNDDEMPDEETAPEDASTEEESQESIEE